MSSTTVICKCVYFIKLSIIFCPHYWGFFDCCLFLVKQNNSIERNLKDVREESDTCSRENTYWGQSESTMGKALAVQAADLVLAFHIVPLELLGMFPEYRASNNS